MSFTQTTNTTAPAGSNKNLIPKPLSNPPMSHIIDTRFSTLSSALETLIKSLSTYNPTPSHAQDVVIADAELTKGLCELHTHQTNHSTLLTLRAQSQDLDTQIKEMLLLLTSTRTEVLNTPSTPFTPTNPVSYSELLSYARRISRTTLPQSYREPTTPPVISQSSGAGQDGEAGNGNTNSNGNSTPLTANVGANGIHEGVKVEGAGGVGEKGEHTTKLPAQFDMAVKLPEGVFTPWPQDGLLRRGALATIQVLIEKGEGLEGSDGGVEEGVKSEEDAGGEDTGKEENTEMGGQGQQQPSQQRRPQVVQKKKAAFELETFDSDDEDDD